MTEAEYQEHYSEGVYCHRCEQPFTLAYINAEEAEGREGEIDWPATSKDIKQTEHTNVEEEGDIMNVHFYCLTPDEQKEYLGELEAATEDTKDIE
jgi:hypothetical protein